MKSSDPGCMRVSCVPVFDVIHRAVSPKSDNEIEVRPQQFIPTMLLDGGLRSAGREESNDEDNLPAHIRSLAEGAGDLPGDAREGENDWKRPGYGGPKPPTGRHRYYFKLYALDTELSDLDSPTKADLERAMKGHVIEEAKLVGTYEHAKEQAA